VFHERLEGTRASVHAIVTGVRARCDWDRVLHVPAAGSLRCGRT
jgi:hypothetical protein